MNDRLPSGLEAKALMRAAESMGGMAMTLAKGDPDRGDHLVLLLDRGTAVSLLTREIGPDGQRHWRALLDEDAEARAFDEAIARRRRVDPDCWVIEVDGVDPARYRAEILEIS
ncbi:DUF1491 family protein [Sphingomicrobium sp. XHP0239]|uniref:DUF1491 family protein n=1 Tax=Sphingomicrobium maritimum TaxID=3133972 RepID=UPI0031CC736C